MSSVLFDNFAFKRWFVCFWTHVERTPGCWLWTGEKNSKGYGRFRKNGQWHLAHRFSWEAFKGPLSDGLCVLHRCDNPRCVNPKHLFLGTQTDNMRDCANKGRLVLPEQKAEGTQHYSAKLTEDDVRAIRRRFASGEGQRCIAESFGLKRTTIAAITQGRTWKHVLDQ